MHTGSKREMDNIMVSKYDEMMCHQTVDYLDRPDSSAREWSERIMILLHDKQGELHHITGFGKYPNRNVMDSASLLSINGESLHGLRASRILNPENDRVFAGPCSYEVIEPLEKIRYQCNENEYGYAFDLEFNATLPCHAEDEQRFIHNNRVVEHVNRYNQSGTATGWIRLDDKRWEITPDRFLIQRDHSWGIRRDSGTSFEVNVEPSPFPEGYFYHWGLFQFEDWAVYYHLRESHDGSVLLCSGGITYPSSSNKPELRIASVDHQLAVNADDSRRITSGSKVLIHFEDGSQKTITITPLNAVPIKPAGYFEYKDFLNGKWHGKDYVDRIDVDMTNPEQRQEVTLLDDTGARLECDGETGYGIVELLVIGKNTKYGFDGY